ncbi:MAG TPA: hypothetical protein DHU33_04640 [Firmicutes bacterium]|nr:hypothetical protein [Bacillota bacterium]
MEKLTMSPICHPMIDNINKINTINTVNTKQICSCGSGKKYKNCCGK